MPEPENATMTAGAPLGLAQSALLLLVRGYRLFFKAWVGNVCRYEPSCSSYMMQAVQRHGAARGAALGTWRILRCNPWSCGGCDPVPEHFPSAGRGLFTRHVSTPEGQAGPSADPTKDSP